MANYSNLISAIQSVITTNENNEITGAILQQTLLSVINTLGAGYQFIGIANPSTNPGNPDDRVFYIGGPGTYSNFGPAVVPSGAIGIFYYDTAWHVETLAFPLGDGAVGTANLADEAVTQGKISPALLSLIKNGYVYKGIAETSTNPGTPERDCFYVATQSGTYTHFGGIVLNDGEFAFLRYDSSWHKDSIDIISDEDIEEMQDEIERIKTELRLGDEGEPIPITIPPSCGATINNQNVWFVSANYYGGLVDVTNYRGYIAKIKGNASRASTYTFLKSGVASGQTPNYATGYSYIVSIGLGEEISVIIPADAVYLYVYLQSQSTDYRPQSITFVPSSGQQTRLEEIEDSIDNLSLELTEKTTIQDSINPSSLTSCGGSISSSTGKWVSVSNYYGSLIPVSGVLGVIIKGNASRISTFAFLKSGISVGNTPEYASGYSGLVSIPLGDVVRVSVPNDAVFLYVYNRSQGNIFLPQEIILLNSIQTKIEELEGESVEHLSLFEYNIGHFSGGVQKNSTITAAQYLSKVDEFRALLSNQKPQIYGIVEYSAIFGKNTAGNNVNTKDELFNFQDVEFESSQMNYACYALFGNNVPIYNVQINDFDCLANETITHTTAITAQDYRYISADVYAFGVTIKLVVTHLAFDNNRPGVLTSAQISELITKYSSYDHVIMLGDWNVASFSEFDAFTNAGYTLANNGSFITYPGGGKALDNIVAKGLTISNVKMISSTLSDHNALTCFVIG